MQNGGLAKWLRQRFAKPSRIKPCMGSNPIPSAKIENQNRKTKWGRQGESFPPEKLFRPAKSALVFFCGVASLSSSGGAGFLIGGVLLKKCSNFVQKTPPKLKIRIGSRNECGRVGFLSPLKFYVTKFYTLLNITFYSTYIKPITKLWGVMLQ